MSQHPPIRFDWAWGDYDPVHKHLFRYITLVDNGSPLSVHLCKIVGLHLNALPEAIALLQGAYENGGWKAVLCTVALLQMEPTHTLRQLAEADRTHEETEPLD